MGRCGRKGGRGFEFLIPHRDAWSRSSYPFVKIKEEEVGGGMVI